MKRILSAILFVVAIAQFVSAQDLTLPRVSQKATVMQTVGLTDITITYSRPGVKGRVIWGELVPYDQVWRTGANEATTIVFSDDVKINGQNLAAGTYSLHTIPGKDQWTIIFNSVAKQWGSYNYDKTKDALRVQAKPQSGPNIEWLTFSFPEVSTSSATVEIAWEKVRVPFQVETNTIDKAVANIQKAVPTATDWNVPYDAAEFAFNQNLDKQQAMDWVNRSIALKETFWNLRLKADMLAKDGKTAEAITLAEKAVALGKANKDEEAAVSAAEKQLAAWKASATK